MLLNLFSMWKTRIGNKPTIRQFWFQMMTCDLLFPPFSFKAWWCLWIRTIWEGPEWPKTTLTTEAKMQEGFRRCVFFLLKVVLGGIEGNLDVWLFAGLRFRPLSRDREGPSCTESWFERRQRSAITDSRGSSGPKGLVPDGFQHSGESRSLRNDNLRKGVTSEHSEKVLFCLAPRHLL